MLPLRRSLSLLLPWRRLSHLELLSSSGFSLTSSSKRPAVPPAKLLCSNRHGYRFYGSQSAVPVPGTVASDECLEDLRKGGEVEYDWDYICDPKNTEKIRRNIENRKGVGDIDLVLDLWRKLESLKASDPNALRPEYQSARKALLEAASDLPNRCHPDAPIGDESKLVQVAVCGKRKEFSFRPKSAVHLAEELGILRTQNVGFSTGPRTYYLKNDLARLEQALVNYTLDVLLKRNFSLISVPDLVSSDIVEGCGFKTTGIRTQVYKLKRERHGDVCLAGTGEIPIAGFFRNQTLDVSDLPKRFCTVSRCYRAEASEVEMERGLYRVHQFTKVEMFGVTANETGRESDQLLHEILSIQRLLFGGLDLEFRVLNMPSQELGAPAFQKFDMEAWLPAKEFWGEISSASNCTDYQSRRMNIKYASIGGGGGGGAVKHCHTVNGTACAVPRLLISILENHQNPDGSIVVPTALQPYMDGLRLIEKAESLDRVTPIRRYHSIRQTVM